MNNKQNLVSAEPFDGDLYRSSQTRECQTRNWMNLDVVLIAGRTA